MTADPIRLLDASDLSQNERELLEAGRRGSPVQYDAVAGAARFRASLAALGVAGAVTTASKGARAVTGKGLFFGGAATKAILAVVLPAVAVGVSVGVYRYVGARNEHAVVRSRIVVEGTGPNDGASSSVAPAPPAMTKPAGGDRRVEGAPTKEDEPEVSPGASAGAEPRARRHHHARGVDGRIPNVRVVLEDDGKDDETEESTSGEPRPAPAERAVDPAATSAVAPISSVAAVVRRPAPPAASVREPAAVASVERPTSPPATPRTAVDETRAIAHARSLLASNPSDALAALEQVRRDFPAGYFVEERRELTIFALLRTGNRAVAIEHAKAFVRAYPNGPFTDKIRSMLGLSP